MKWSEWESTDGVRWTTITRTCGAWKLEVYRDDDTAIGCCSLSWFTAGPTEVTPARFDIETDGFLVGSVDAMKRRGMKFVRKCKSLMESLP